MCFFPSQAFCLDKKWPLECFPDEIQEVIKHKYVKSKDNFIIRLSDQGGQYFTRNSSCILCDGENAEYVFKITSMLVLEFIKALTNQGYWKYKRLRKRGHFRSLN